MTVIQHFRTERKDGEGLCNDNGAEEANIG